MADHIGIVACSAEGAALCYRTVCCEGARYLGEHAHPEISMHTYPLSDYMKHITTGNWFQVAELMLSSAWKLRSIGADFAICPDNTIHQAFDIVIEKSPIPWLHIAEEVAREAVTRGYRTIGVLGTKFLMEGPVYPEQFKRFDLACLIPDESERNRINDIIFQELVYGQILPESRRYFYAVIQQLKERRCDAVALSCTEIPLIVDPDQSPLPTLDSTRLLARAALKKAVGE